MPMDRDNRGPRGRKRRKVCAFCVDKVECIDYKDAAKLRRYISERAKILPRRTTGTCAMHQRALGQQSHEAGFGAAVDQRVACGTDPCSQFPDGLRQMGVGAAAGTQIYGDVHRRYLRG